MSPSISTHLTQQIATSGRPVESGPSRHSASYVRSSMNRPEHCLKDWLQRLTVVRSFAGTYGPVLLDAFALDVLTFEGWPGSAPSYCSLRG